MERGFSKRSQKYPNYDDDDDNDEDDDGDNDDDNENDDGDGDGITNLATLNNENTA